MKGLFNIVDPAEVEMELTLTMRLKEWKELQEQLNKDWPSCDLSSKITDMVVQAYKCFWPNSEES